MEFFIPMVPPTITHQEKKVRVVNGKPIFYEPEKLKTFHTGVQLVTKWCFPRGRHKDGDYRLTKPDTDNLQKLLKDCMTVIGFWDDDALVASEVVEKFWAEIPGIYIKVTEL